MEKTVVYKKRYADRTRANVQAEAQDTIQKAFMNAEKMMNRPTNGEVTIAFTNDEAESTLTVRITAPETLMKVFTKIFKGWKRSVQIHNTVSRRLYKNKMETNSNVIPHNPNVNRNRIPSYIGEISEYANFKGLPIANMAKYHWNRTAKRNRHGRIYNTNSAAAFAAFQHTGGPTTVDTTIEKERLIDRYTAEEIQNAIVANPDITPNELLKIGYDAYMFVAKPLFAGEKDHEQLIREASQFVPLMIKRYRGIRSRYREV